MTRQTARMVGLAVGIAATPAAAQMYDGMWHGTWGWGHMAVGVLMILFWSALVVLVVLVVRWFAARFAEQRRREGSALQILEERFARGEIDRQEFEERKQVLANKVGASKGRST